MSAFGQLHRLINFQKCCNQDVKNYGCTDHAVMKLAISEGENSLSPCHVTACLLQPLLTNAALPMVQFHYSSKTLSETSIDKNFAPAYGNKMDWKQIQSTMSSM